MTFADQWKLLHGSDLPAPIAAAAPAASTENAQWRPPDFLDQPNVFLAAILAAQSGDKLPLWEPLANLVPAEALPNGDELLLHVPNAPGPLCWLVWDHARDAVDRALARDLGNRPPGDPANPLRFASRAAYLVELLARGRLDLDLFSQTLDTVTVAVNDQLKGNVRAFPPTGIFVPWHLFFLGRDAEARALADVASQSPARFIRDAAALLAECLAGRRDLGSVTDLPALRAEAVAASDPTRRARLLAAKNRAATDQRLASQKGPRLVRRDAPPAPPATPEPSIASGDLELSVRSTRGRTALAASRNGRVLSARDLAGGRLAPSESLGSLLYRAGPGLAALLQPFAPGAKPVPYKGAVSVFRAHANQVQLVASFQLDVTQLEQHQEALLVRASDGSAYAFEGLEQGPAPGAFSPPPPPPLPGAPATPPSTNNLAFPGLRLELTTTSLRAFKGDQLLWEEPLVEAYAMALLPARRLAAVHHLTDELRPVVDLLYLRDLDAPVAAGEGCASWVSFPVDGRDLELRSDGEHLFVAEDGAWKQLDDAAFAQPPAYLQARGWL